MRRQVLTAMIFFPYVCVAVSPIDSFIESGGWLGCNYTRQAYPDKSYCILIFNNNPCIERPFTPKYLGDRPRISSAKSLLPALRCVDFFNRNSLTKVCDLMDLVTP